MRRLLIVSFLILILAVGWQTYGGPETGTGTLTLPQPAPNVGENAPNFTAPTLDGEDFRVTDEGTYVLTFWSTLNQDSSQANPGLQSWPGTMRKKRFPSGPSTSATSRKATTAYPIRY